MDALVALLPLLQPCPVPAIFMLAIPDNGVPPLPLEVGLGPVVGGPTEVPPLPLVFPTVGGSCAAAGGVGTAVGGAAIVSGGRAVEVGGGPRERPRALPLVSPLVAMLYNAIESQQ